MAESDIKRYRLPTHLKVEDTLTIGIFKFTVRQIALLLAGGGCIYFLWQQLAVPPPWLAAWFPALPWLALVLVLRLVLAVCLGLLTLALAYVRVKGKTLETYLWLRLEYVVFPSCYTWRPVPDLALVQSQRTRAKRRDTAKEQTSEQDDG